MPELAGLFGVKFPVSDLARSRVFYERVFGLSPLFEFPDEGGVVRGVAYEIPGVPGTCLALRENSPVAAGISGFDPVIFSVADRAAVDAWAAHLAACAVAHDVVPGTLGWVVVFHDPDGTEIHLYSREPHGLDRVGAPGHGRSAGAEPGACTTTWTTGRASARTASSP